MCDLGITYTPGLICFSNYAGLSRLELLLFIFKREGCYILSVGETRASSAPF